MTFDSARILIVEDEPIVGIALEDMLAELGVSFILFADRLDEAEALLVKEQIDAAVLDVNIHGRASYPLADEMMRRNIPFIFATGYGDKGHPERFASVPTVAKPYGTNDIGRALKAALDSR